MAVRPDEGGSGSAIVIRPALRRAGAASDEDMLDEACALAGAIDLEIIHAECLPVRRPRPATFLGKGQVEHVETLAKMHEHPLIVVDAPLSPIQQRNLERAWSCKVIDRTALILEIFGARARTHEGRLQVELAALEYQRSRLVRSWTHLERQRGALGFVGGPGESQLELDRRLIDDRVKKIRQDLETVRRTRGLHREARERVPYPIVALAGYTNAGKSTLFNRLTGATVTAEDQLFATLDPTLRAVRLPSGRSVILSDTVGFISDLPTQLVAAFRATLEEVVNARIILHVHDVANEASDAQAEAVRHVLAEIGAGETAGQVLIDVLNKVDLLPPERIAAFSTSEEDGSRGGQVAVSAKTGEGCDALIAAIEQVLSVDRTVRDLSVSLTDGARIAWLYRHGEVIERHDDDTMAHIRVSLDDASMGRFPPPPSTI